MIAVGEHTGVVCANWWETNKKDHSPVLVVQVDVGGERITGRIWFTDKSAGMARAQLRAFGFDCDRRGLDEIEPNGFEGQEIVVQVEEDNYNGRAGTKIARFGRGRSAPPQASALADATRLVRAAKKEEEPTPYSEPVEEIPPLTSANVATEAAEAKRTDDGIPF